MSETLNEFGYGFQIKLLSALLSDRAFAGRIVDILKPEHFDADQNKWIGKTILEYFYEYKELPTAEVLRAELVRTVPKSNELLRKEIVGTIKEIFHALESPDLEYIKGAAIDFCKEQNAKKVILECVDDIKKKRYDSLIPKMEAAVRVGSDFSLGEDYKDGIEERYQQEVLTRIPTGWDVINDYTGGGIPKGKLATIMAPLGAGKTFTAVSVGAAAVKQGFTVAFCTLELSAIEIKQRFDSAFLGMPLENIPMHLDTLKKQAKALKGELHIKEFLSGVSLMGIESYLDQCILLGIKPDVVIIDYDELIDLHYPTEYRYDQQMQFLYRDIRRKIAIGKNTAVWLLAQSSKVAAEEDITRMTHSANSYGKNREVDFTLTLNRGDRDKMSNTARFLIGKSRLGPDGITLPAEFNPNIGSIKIFHPNSKRGQDETGKMIDNNEFNRQVAANYYADLKLNNNRTERKELF